MWRREGEKELVGGMALAWQTKSQVFVVCAEAKGARGESVHDLFMREGVELGMRNTNSNLGLHSPRLKWRTIRDGNG